ncbi:MAG: arginyltransferase [Pelagibacteraceae bacterium TMED124]|nr:arginyltransferase [Rickettsiales bacterium]RPG19345.1 MAG: arginyltransferase [Pelagibacteraceae bacterium TMED124]
MNEFNEKKIEFKKSISFPCSYLAGNTERRLYVNLNKNENNKLLISELTKNGFRRSHEHMYIPVCEGCNACISSRINIKGFKFTKSNLRVIKFNSDLSFKKNFDNSHKHYELFKNYCFERHESSQMIDMSIKEFNNFFFESKNENQVFDLVDSSNNLLGSILVDTLNDGYSAVYSFFDPYKSKRSLGKLLILKLINELKIINKPFLYLGYWIKNSQKMLYKANFNNVEFFIDGNWKNKNLTNF